MWTSSRIASDQVEPLLSVEEGGGIEIYGEGKSKTIASNCDVERAEIDAKAAQVAWMRLGGENGTRKEA